MATARSRKTWTPSPSPSPTHSSASESDSARSPPPAQTRSTTNSTTTSSSTSVPPSELKQTKPTRPSQVKPPPGLEPLIKLSPEDLAGIVQWDENDEDDNQLEDDDDDDDSEADTEGHPPGEIKIRHFQSGHDEDQEEVLDPPALWEHLVDALLWTIPFAFLFVGMQVFLSPSAMLGRDALKGAIFTNSNCNPSQTPTAIYILNIISPTTLTNPSTQPASSATTLPILPPRIQQPLLLLLCATTGTHLVHLTSTQSYLKVMASAPAFGTLWVWSVVKMDLGWAVAGLMLVGVGVAARGEMARVKWWWN
ncbi:BQ2448_4771 [Microbotryum intermedium]|uniref:BQ2448_4771 protein n=1 Tax=Microbotryum intermedium TaxID=269621 RepID=A0A238FFR4_9BASI|nr:BQ2448_4771 [Microbotryum intermedium]